MMDRVFPHLVLQPVKLSIAEMEAINRFNSLEKADEPNLP
jgi:hypothetical protein